MNDYGAVSDTVSNAAFLPRSFRLAISLTRGRVQPRRWRTAATRTNEEHVRVHELCNRMRRVRDRSTLQRRPGKWCIRIRIFAMHGA